MRRASKILDCRLLIADLWVCDAFHKKRPTPMNRTGGAICIRKLSIREFHKSEISNQKSAMEKGSPWHA